MICHLDQTEHADRAAMHRHLRGQIKQADYYTRYEPRYDLFTGEPIPFKTVEQYLNQDFLTKDNIRGYLTRERVKGREWAVNWLRRRKEEKGLVYAPSQVELRSLQCPSMPYYDSVGGYYTITRELGFAPRFEDMAGSGRIMAGLSGATIIQDTREQLPLKLPLKTVVAKLDYGDYALAAPHDQGIYIERKGLGDFAGTLSSRKIERKKKGEDSAFERFDRELARAHANGHYIVMLVEADIQTALNYDDEKSPHYVYSMRHSEAGAAHCFKNLRDLLTKYPLSFQAVFAKGREEAARVAIRVFEMGKQVRSVDLQNAYEKGLL